jgi:hypothetical protein
MSTSLSAKVDQLPKRRGRLLNASKIARDLFSETVSPRWVRQNVAPEAKLVLGHSTVVWWEQDVIEWLESARGTRNDF